MAAYSMLMSVRAKGVPAIALALAIILALAACQSGNSNTTADNTNNPSASSSTPNPSASSSTPNPSAPPTTSSPTVPPATTWAQLEQRPLHLPTLAPGAPCPVTPAHHAVSPDFGDAVGSGPVYLVAGLTNGVLYYNPPQDFDASAGPWGGAKVLWQIKPEYTGLVLIRGQQVDGTHILDFNGGVDFKPTNALGSEPLLKELHLKGGGSTSASWPTWVTFTRVEAPGCYAYQIDGEKFTEVIIFQALST